MFPAPVHSDQHSAPGGTGPSVHYRPPAVRHQRQHHPTHGAGEGAAPDPRVHGHLTAAPELLPPPECGMYPVPGRPTHHGQSQLVTLYVNSWD